MATILPAFEECPEEALIIGRLIAGYGELEFDMALCVRWMIDDEETAFKVIYRAPGEVQRILMADALVRSRLAEGKERTIFEKAIAGMHVCRKIRNQYAHSNWLVQDGILTFLDPQKGAEGDSPFMVNCVPFRQLGVAVLQEQETYFLYVSACLDWLNREAQLRAGEISSNPHPLAPREIPSPRFHN
jgi:hypothetical protein